MLIELIDGSKHVSFLYGFPAQDYASALEDERELGQRVSFALDYENNCKESWLPCWCRVCTPEIHPRRLDAPF